MYKEVEIITPTITAKIKPLSIYGLRLLERFMTRPDYPYLCDRDVIFIWGSGEVAVRFFDNEDDGINTPDWLSVGVRA